MSEEHSLKSEKKSESEASVPGEKTEEEEKEEEQVLLLRNVSSEHLRIGGAQTRSSASSQLRPLSGRAQVLTHSPGHKGDPTSDSVPSLRLEPTLSTQALHASSKSDMKLSPRSRSIAQSAVGARGPRCAGSILPRWSLLGAVLVGMLVGMLGFLGCSLFYTRRLLGNSRLGLIGPGRCEGFPPPRAS